VVHSEFVPEDHLTAEMAASLERLRRVSDDHQAGREGRQPSACPPGAAQRRDEAFDDTLDQRGGAADRRDEAADRRDEAADRRDETQARREAMLDDRQSALEQRAQLLDRRESEA
jgi:hypothetical protein